MRHFVFDDNKALQKTIQTRGDVIFRMNPESIERRGRPALVLMNIAERIIDKNE